MSQPTSNKKTLALLGAVVIVLAAVAAFFYFGQGDARSSSTPVQKAEQQLQEMQQNLPEDVKKANAPPPEIERTAKKGPVKGK